MRQLGFTAADLKRDEVLTWGQLSSGTPVNKGTSLFPRIESKPQGAKNVSDSPASSQPTTATPLQAPLHHRAYLLLAAAPAPASPAQITIDEFMKVQLKTAKVVTAERVPKSEKLLKLQVSSATNNDRLLPASARNTSRRPWSAKPSSSWRI